MKELSIKEKAKRYDEAIKLAKDSYNYPSYPGFIRADVVFPELRESECERIRKEIIDYLKQRLKTASSIPTAIGRWINWLEAQGEQKPLGFNIGDEITVNGQICKVVAVEQKPTEWTEEDEKMYAATIFALAGFMGNEDKQDWLKSLKYRVQHQNGYNPYKRIKPITTV